MSLWMTISGYYTDNKSYPKFVLNLTCSEIAPNYHMDPSAGTILFNCSCVRIIDEKSSEYMT